MLPWHCEFVPDTVNQCQDQMSQQTCNINIQFHTQDGRTEKTRAYTSAVFYTCRPRITKKDVVSDSAFTENNNSTSAGLVQITIQHCSRKHSRRSASVNTEGGIEQLYGCQHKRAVKVLCAAPRWDETESFQELPQQRWEVLSRVDPVQDLPAEFTYRKSNKHQWLSPVCSLTGPYWYLV